MRSVDHESSWITATSGSPPSAATESSSARFITSSAGQPRKVGVNSIRTRSPSTSTSRITPSSTSEMTGISGSGISPIAAQTCSTVTTVHLSASCELVSDTCSRRGGRSVCARCQTPCGSPVRTRDGAADLGHLVPELCELGRMLAALRRFDNRAPDAARELFALRRLEHPERVRPQLLDGRAEARLVPEAPGPHLGVHAVVDLFAVDLRREPRELHVVAAA